MNRIHTRLIPRREIEEALSGWRIYVAAAEQTPRELERALLWARRTLKDLETAYGSPLQQTSDAVSINILEGTRDTLPHARLVGLSQERRELERPPDEALSMNEADQLMGIDERLRSVEAEIRDSPWSAEKLLRMTIEQVLERHEASRKS